MHALQLLPLLAHFVLRHKWLVLVTAVLYAMLAAGVLVLALAGRPLIGRGAPSPSHHRDPG
jgi:hypothetical protein